LPREIGTVVLGRDHHHDVSGTDSPYRNIYIMTDPVLLPIWRYKT
jgi:urocanate hydratase